MLFSGVLCQHGLSKSILIEALRLQWHRRRQTLLFRLTYTSGTGSHFGTFPTTSLMAPHRRAGYKRALRLEMRVVSVKSLRNYLGARRIPLANVASQAMPLKSEHC